jgi:hypothetical protein
MGIKMDSADPSQTMSSAFVCLFDLVKTSDFEAIMKHPSKPPTESAGTSIAIYLVKRPIVHLGQATKQTR